MESGAKGCEVVVSGKLRGQRAKSMKFVDGLMIHSGEPTNDYVNTATRHVLLRQGTINIFFFEILILYTYTFQYVIRRIYICHLNYRCIGHKGKDYVAMGSKR